MKISIYRITYHVVTETDQQAAENYLLKEIGRYFLESNFAQCEIYARQLQTKQWPTQRVVSSPFTHTIAADSREKAIASLPMAPEGSENVIDNVQTLISDVGLA